MKKQIIEQTAAPEGPQPKPAKGPWRLWMERLSLPLYMLSLLGTDLLFQRLYGFVGGAVWPNKLALAFTLLWVLLLGAVAALLPRLGGRIFIVLTVLLSVILTVVHAVMFHLFGNFFRFSDMLYAGEGAAFFSMQYVQMRKLLAGGLVLFFLMGAAAAVFLPKRPYGKLRVLACVGAILLSAGGLYLLNRSNTVSIQIVDKMEWSVGVKQQTVDPETTRKQQYTEFLDANVCLPMVGLYQYSFRDLTQTIFSASGQERTRALSELSAAHDARPEHTENEMTGLLAGKNLIVIMVESLDTWMITEDYMPNLYALQQQSVRFEHFYTPLYLNAGTFSTEFVTQSGIIPPISGVSTDAYMDNALPAALPRLFAAEGYTVNSFHSANPTIYNRGKIHENLGFEAYHNYVAMGMDDYMLDSQMLNGFESLVDRDGPFYSFVITYSGHGPYNDSMDNIAQPHMEQARAAVAASGVTGSADTMDQYVRAVSHIMETDDYIGGLVERLEEAGLMDDTVLIIFGDHYCKYLTDADFLMELKGVPNRNLLCNTPLLIWSRDLEPAAVEKYTASPDLYPTICNLFDLKVDLRYFVGDDMFGSEGGMVYWRDNCCYDGETYVDSAQAASFTEKQQQMYNLAHQKLNFSWNTFRYDLFSTVNPLPTK